IDELVLRDVRFTPEFTKAIEAKTIAQQSAEQMKYTLEKEQKEAERKVIEARGRANAIEVINQALAQNPNYIKYLYVDKLSDKIAVIVSDQNTIMDLKGILDSHHKRTGPGARARRASCDSTVVSGRSPCRTGSAASARRTSSRRGRSIWSAVRSAEPSPRRRPASRRRSSRSRTSTSWPGATRRVSLAASCSSPGAWTASTAARATAVL